MKGEVIIKKVVKKCSECNELDYILETENICSDCRKKNKKRNEDILSI